MIQPGPIMKTIFALLLLTPCLVHGQFLTHHYAPAPPPPPPPTPIEITAQQLQAAQRFFAPTDPWRMINDLRYYAKGPDWVQFVGKVIEVQKAGIRVSGWYGAPLTLPRQMTDDEMMIVKRTDADPGLVVPVMKEFFVAGFPYDVVDGQVIGWERKYVARIGNSYSYATVSGGSRTLERLDYGMVTSEPPPRQLTPAEKAAVEEKKAKAKTEADAKLLTWQQQLADKGDAYGLYRMGERYVTGNGVEKDMQRGQALLKKSAAAGNAEAGALLEKMFKPVTAEK